jgi:hypothetical protein
MYFAEKNAKTFDPWNQRKKPCPGTEPVPIVDYPDLPAGTGFTRDQEIYLDITVNSAADCKCKQKTATVFARVTLQMNNGVGTARSGKSLDQLPNPPGPPPLDAN